MVLSDQIPLMATLQKRFISFKSKCFSSSNSIVNLISHLAITNPLSSAGKNYRSVIDADCELNNRHSIIKWNNSRKEIENTVTIVKELIDVRDGYKERISFSLQEIDLFMLDLCTAWLVHYFNCLYFFIMYYLYVICISKCTILILLLYYYV